ncbi:hypothetical protein CRP01_01005 [Flavilitoribacter nigricans DSM 23189 = NBRC 102662]|uniref:Uncharacterized protein n=2 Tax=Flavilitoribacter TaxID=2762562 RepID=A0A2D0NJ51_FLAN2|nr:hypothetical protein CRP01_01005 [Flavilitoribacter nigricans DSM 23189 = NBRC 102662]
MAQSSPFDQLLEKGHSLLSGYTPEDCSCFGEYYARKHIREGNFALLDSEWVPIFELKGYSHCRLADFGFAYKIIPDLFLPADDRPKARAYIERYNALMLYELKGIAGEENYEDIFHPPSMLDPYVLRERLHQLARFGQITRSEWKNDETVRIRLDLKPLYRNLDLDWKKLRFLIVDENKTDSQYILSLEDLDKEGFPLVINSESRKSNVWFDFKIRVEYSHLTEDGELFTCEQINDFLYEFDHLSLTKDLRLITHLH